MPIEQAEETEPATQESDQSIVPGVRYTLAALFIGVAIAATIGIARYAWRNPGATPAQLRLHEVLLAAVVFAAFVLFPWQRTGWRLKKVGWVEFERIATAQKREQVESASLLEQRVAHLEETLSKRLAGAPAEPGGSSEPRDARTRGPGLEGSIDDLRQLILGFLKAHPKSYVNAAHIRNRGGEEAGFEKLKSYPTALITQQLQHLLAQGLVRHRVSVKSGSTLYSAVRSRG